MKQPKGPLPMTVVEADRPIDEAEARANVAAFVRLAAELIAAHQRQIQNTSEKSKENPNGIDQQT